MSYQVIALKWRPKTFEGMMGQTHVSQTLLNALRTQCLPQALLFTGPRGTGKTSAARILAKSLRCTHLEDYVPCGQCKDCEDISLSRSLDVIEIDGASNNGVDSIRDLRDSVNFYPTTGHKKIYIIDEVHMLSTNAFNALLKTLEEPPEHVIFILATTEVHKIPKTILSRCHRFDFRRVSIQDLANYLEYICKEENIKYETQALWAIARQGEGSVRDAFSFLDQAMTYSSRNITYASVIESLGLTDRRLLTQILSGIINQDIQGLIQNLDSIFSSGADAGVFSEDLLEEIKNLLIIKSVGFKSNHLDIPDAEAQMLLEMSQGISEAHIHLLFDMMLETSQSLLRSQDQRTVLEMGLLKLCLYPQVFDMQKRASQTLSSLETLSSPPPQRLETKNSMSFKGPKSRSPKPSLSQQRGSSSGSSVATSSPALASKVTLCSASVGSASVGLASVGSASIGEDKKNTSMSLSGLEESQKIKVWHNFIAKVKRLNIKMGTTLQNCLYTISEDQVRLAAPEKLIFIRKDIEHPQFQKNLEEYIKTFLDSDYKLVIDLESDNKAPDSFLESGKTAAKEQEDLEVENHKKMMDQVSQSEIVKEIKERFNNAKVISIKEMEGR